MPLWLEALGAYKKQNMTIDKDTYLNDYKNYGIREVAKMYKIEIEWCRTLFHHFTNYEYYTETFMFGNIEKCNVVCRGLGYKGSFDYICQHGAISHRQNILPLIKKTIRMETKKYFLIPLLMEGSKFCLYTPDKREVIVEVKNDRPKMPKGIIYEEQRIIRKLFKQYNEQQESR